MAMENKELIQSVKGLADKVGRMTSEIERHNRAMRDLNVLVEKLNAKLGTMIQVDKNTAV